MVKTNAKRRFEYTDDSSNKFWEIETNGKEVTVRWGRIGTTGQAQVKAFGDGQAATKHAEKLIGQKLAKGYVDIE